VGRIAPVVFFFILVFGLAVPVRAQWPQDEGTFTGFWTVSGSVHVLERGDRVVATAGRLTGKVVGNTSQGAIPAFDTDCVVFSDTRERGIARCVWTGATGDQIYVDVTSDGPAGFGRARGEFAGGTGRYDGMSGSFQFEWNYSLGRGADATLDGHTLQMSGRYRLRAR